MTFQLVDVLINVWCRTIYTIFMEYFQLIISYNYLFIDKYYYTNWFTPFYQFITLIKTHPHTINKEITPQLIVSFKNTYVCWPAAWYKGGFNPTRGGGESVTANFTPKKKETSPPPLFRKLQWLPCNNNIIKQNTLERPLKLLWNAQEIPMKFPWNTI